MAISKMAKCCEQKNKKNILKKNKKNACLVFDAFLAAGVCHLGHTRVASDFSQRKAAKNKNKRNTETETETQRRCAVPGERSLLL